ncbi:hypothetical protein E2C01_024110 [Portunus trituberculatus]|uniref:Protein kinase domain-containing protein n=1 Tax=Portunus trituberculatus TaxID=210409 RepID=A0A5B7E9P8_PORTR|nr:hypothetical protein [Portunus trituberculatus]
MALAPVYQFQELPEGLELVAPFGRFRVHSGIAVGSQRLIFSVRHIGELQWRGRDILVQELLGPTLRDILLSYDHQPSSPWLITTLTTHLLRCYGQDARYQAPECVMWSKAVAEDNLESAEKPGTAADMWSAGCIVAECVINRQLFPAGFQCEDVPGDLHSAITSVKTNFPPKYLEGCYKFLLRCIQLCPADRERVRQLLEDPWLQQCPRPSFHDLLHIPTRVVRFMALTDPHPYPPLAYGELLVLSY